MLGIWRVALLMKIKSNEGQLGISVLAKASHAPPSHAEHMQAMDTKMKTMREMHEKMTKAKTPEERNALMAEHMKTMHEGMDMMQMMMQMMMERMPAK